MAVERGTVYKRCGCRDPRTKRQLGTRCPKRRRRGHGSWYIALPVTPNAGIPTGRIRHGGYRTRADAEHALVRLTHPRHLNNTLITVAQWLTHWHDQAERRLRPTTSRNYRKHVENHLIPLLGTELLTELTAERVQRAFNTLIRQRLDADLPIRPANLHRIQATLSSALGAAIRAGSLTRNPARYLDLPRPVRQRPEVWNEANVARWRRTGWRPAVSVWTPTQAVTFLARIHDHRLYALFHLYTLRGLRRGEALGLQWSDIDLNNRSLTIKRQIQQRDGGVLQVCPPKTPYSRRTVALDGHSLAVLRAHRGRQQDEKTTAGSHWTDSDYVFTDPRGHILKPDAIGKLLQRLVRTHDLPPVRLHDLRHGSASYALAANVHLKTISDQHGHTSSVTTADTYISILPEIAHEGAEATARLLLTAARKLARTRRHQPKRHNGQRRSSTDPAPAHQSPSSA
ncbi:tyrosine-type recombinase/integrase [Kitasatospora sp. NPDC001574]